MIKLNLFHIFLFLAKRTFVIVTELMFPQKKQLPGYCSFIKREKSHYSSLKCSLDTCKTLQNIRNGLCTLIPQLCNQALLYFHSFSVSVLWFIYFFMLLYSCIQTYVPLQIWLYWKSFVKSISSCTFVMHTHSFGIKQLLVTKPFKENSQHIYRHN